MRLEVTEGTPNAVIGHDSLNYRRQSLRLDTGRFTYGFHKRIEIGTRQVDADNVRVQPASARIQRNQVLRDIRVAARGRIVGGRPAVPVGAGDPPPQRIAKADEGHPGVVDLVLRRHALGRQRTRNWEEREQLRARAPGRLHVQPSGTAVDELVPAAPVDTRCLRPEHVADGVECHRGRRTRLGLSPVFAHELPRRRGRHGIVRPESPDADDILRTVLSLGRSVNPAPLIRRLVLVDAPLLREHGIGDDIGGKGPVRKVLAGSGVAFVPVGAVKDVDSSMRPSWSTISSSASSSPANAESPSSGSAPMMTIPMTFISMLPFPSARGDPVFGRDRRASALFPSRIPARSGGRGTSRHSGRTPR